MTTDPNEDVTHEDAMTDSTTDKEKNAMIRKSMLALAATVAVGAAAVRPDHRVRPGITTTAFHGYHWLAPRHRDRRAGLRVLLRSIVLSRPAAVCVASLVNVCAY